MQIARWALLVLQYVECTPECKYLTMISNSIWRRLNTMKQIGKESIPWVDRSVHWLLDDFDLKLTTSEKVFWTDEKADCVNKHGGIPRTLVLLNLSYWNNRTENVFVSRHQNMEESLCNERQIFDETVRISIRFDSAQIEENMDLPFLHSDGYFKFIL